ncbi:RmlC-like cupin domain-containing protein [Dendryphion nanum]|uniref:RmlC-like cupin domain-containing protein n=1 Tax=Dendryphion nanum TaxID=256645 RepID=A0A9P9ID11_9PLEO|nr:RmlC-like cupin domain-containing protein [Dendryphion nanum]
MESRSAQDVINKLNMKRHVEKGWYTETFRDPGKVDDRSHSTAIYYLLEGSLGKSHWHRVDAAEVWHYYAGAPLVLELSYDNSTPSEQRVLGPNIFEDQAPQVVIEKDRWQRAQSLGEWTLVGATVAPGFIEAAFEMAAPDWEPKDGRGPGTSK